MTDFTPPFTLYANSVIANLCSLIEDSPFSGLREAFDNYQELLDLNSDDFFELNQNTDCAFQILSAELFITAFGYPSKHTTVYIGHLQQLHKPLVKLKDALEIIAKTYNMEIEFIT